jgi:hypothetical protein
MMPGPRVSSKNVTVRTTGKWLMGISLTLVACQRDLALAPDSGKPAWQISDGGSGGDRRFNWLPPIEPAPITQGVFDANAFPVVRICALATPTTCVAGAPLATYSRTAGTMGELITVDPVG